MAISEELAKILAARYGRDVRQAIHDAIEENYEDVSAARTLADSATTAANNAASLANTKAGLADEKASLANTKAGLAEDAATAANNAASLANTKAGLADEKASLANTKAGLADSAATAANDAASLANAKAGLADSATTAANNAASLANTKASLADEKASLANTKAGLADSAATAANNAASLANTKAGLADSAATAANNAASLANTKAGLADEAAQDATDAAAYANAITQKYIHIRYSAINPDSDDDMTSTPSDWIGIYSGTSASAPTSYTSYAWFKYKGETGDLSIYGVGNADGNIPLNNGVVSVNLNADKLDGLDSTDFAAVSHPHVKADITDFPTSMPASDVSAWAKAATKPAYTPSEVGAAPAVHDHDLAYLGKTAKAADSDKLDGVHLADIRLGKNLLHNWDFRNPVNQRGVSGSVSSNGYFYDRWIRYDSPSTSPIILGSGYITLPVDVLLGQNIEGLLLGGKTVTLSIMLSDGSIHTHTNSFPLSSSPSGTLNAGSDSLAYYKFRRDPTSMHVQIIPASASLNIVCVKLELGPVSTLHLDPPMDHAVEFAKCRRYFKNDFRQMGRGVYVSAGHITMVLTFENGFRVNPTVSIPSYENLLVCPNVGEYTPSSHTVGGYTKYHTVIDFFGTFTNANYGVAYASTSSALLMSLSADL